MGPLRRLIGLGILLSLAWMALWLARGGVYSTPQAVAPGTVFVRLLDRGQVLFQGNVRPVPLRDLLQQHRIPLNKETQIFVNGKARSPDQLLPVPGPVLVEVIEPVRVMVDTPQKVRMVTTHALTVGQLLEDLNIHPASDDYLEPPQDTRLQQDMYIVWRPKRSVTLQWNGRTWTGQGVGDTIGQVLATAGFPLQGLDSLEPSETAPATEGIKASWRRLEEARVIDLEVIPPPAKTEFRALPDVPIDTIKVVSTGQPGLKVKVYRQVRVGQEKVERVLEREWVLQWPQPRVVGYGTKIVVKTIETPHGPVKCWRIVRVYATSYSPCRVYGPGGPCDDITASGKKLRKGIVAVRLSWYRAMKGLRVYVPGYGFGEIADVGGGIPGRRWIDLGFSEEDYQSIHQWVDLCFVAPPPPPDRILWILP